MGLKKSWVTLILTVILCMMQNLSKWWFWWNKDWMLFINLFSFERIPLSSTHQFHTKNPSVQHTPQFHTKNQHLYWGVLNWGVCWTEEFLVLNWGFLGAEKVWSLCCTDVLRWGICVELRGTKLSVKRQKNEIKINKFVLLKSHNLYGYL